MYERLDTRKEKRTWADLPEKERDRAWKDVQQVSVLKGRDGKVLANEGCAEVV